MAVNSLGNNSKKLVKLQINKYFWPCMYSIMSFLFNNYIIFDEQIMKNVVKTFAIINNTLENKLFIYKKLKKSQINE